MFDLVDKTSSAAVFGGSLCVSVFCKVKFMTELQKTIGSLRNDDGDGYGNVT